MPTLPDSFLVYDVDVKTDPTFDFDVMYSARGQQHRATAYPGGLK